VLMGGNPLEALQHLVAGNAEPAAEARRFERIVLQIECV
jgi:hypothetical protein